MFKLKFTKNNSDNSFLKSKRGPTQKFWAGRGTQIPSCDLDSTSTLKDEQMEKRKKELRAFLVVGIEMVAKQAGK